MKHPILVFIVALFCLNPIWVSAQDATPTYLFVENKGQWGTEVQYGAEIPGGRLFISPKGINYIFVQPPSHHGHDHAPGAQEQHQAGIKVSAIQVDFIGANTKAKPIATGVQSADYNYFIGNDSTLWASGCKAFVQLTYENIYEGIDLKMYSQGENLKYDLIVKPFADVSQVKFRYMGQDSIWLSSGSIIADARISALIENEPYSYQTGSSNLRSKVSSMFVLDGNVLSFAFPDGYDREQTLVIDPELIFSTFSGSISDNFGFTACFDNDGNLYSGGIVFGPQFPVSTGRPYGGGQHDIAIQKFDSTGRRLLYSTIIGGSGSESPHSLVVNNRNELVIMGTTGSKDYPTSASAYNRIFNGGEYFTIFDEYLDGSDIIVTKLGPTGAIVASTYIGGPDNDGILQLDAIGIYRNGLIQNYGDYQRGDVYVDENDNIYVASSTDGDGFPTTGSIQPVYGGGRSDAVVFSLSPSLTLLRFSTYLGGNGEDAAYSIKLDKQGNIIVGGGTRSANFPTTQGVIRPTFGGQIDGFVLKLDRFATRIVQSTFLGTNRDDQVYFVDVDENDNIYAAGQTRGAYPVTPGAYRNANSGQFIHKMTNDLSSTVFSTVFGSGGLEPNISLTAFLANDCDNIFLSGWGGSINNSLSSNRGNTFNMPVTSDAIRRQTDGSDFYLMALSADGSRLLYATFFGATNNGGDHVDGGTSRFDKRGIMYQSVCTCGGLADNFPTTPGAWSRINLGRNANGDPRCNTASFKFDLATLRARYDTSLPDNSQPGITKGCAPFTVKFRNNSAGGETNLWTLGDGTTFQNRDTLVYTFSKPGVYQVSLSVFDDKTCQLVDVMSKEITVYGGDLTISPDVAICTGESTQLQASGAVNYTWTPATGLNNPNIHNPIARPQATTKYKVTATTSQGCVEEKEVTVTVVPFLVASFETNTPDGTQPGILSGCAPITINFTNTSNAGKKWYFDLGNNSRFENVKEFDVFFEKAGVYTMQLTVEDEDLCSPISKASKIITIYGDSLQVSPAQTICEGESIQLSATGGVIYTWAPSQRMDDPTSATPIVAPLVNTLYKVKANTANGCEREDSVRVNVLPLLVPSFTTNAPDGSKPGLNDGCAPLTVRFNNASRGGKSVTWNFGDGTSVNNVQGVTHVFQEQGVYEVVMTVTDDRTCTAEESISTTITVYGLNVSISPDATICDGESTPLLATGGASYLWTPATGLSDTRSPSPTASPRNTTTYTVRITTAEGCVVDSLVKVTVIRNIEEDFSFERIEKCLDPPLYIFTNNTQGAPSVWNLGDGTKSPQRIVQHTYQRDGVYTVSVETDFACVIDKEMVIDYEAFIVPNAFSPNGDGINDFFEVRTERAVSLRVLDRTGRQVFWDEDYRNNWSGNDLAVGTYFYTLTFDDGETCQGWVKLLR